VSTGLYSTEHIEQQTKLHESDKHYGTMAKNYANHILMMSKQFETKDILDYGCGKGTLQQNLPFLIKQYDPAIPKHAIIPEPADIVVCLDVLEHIEPDKVDSVLEHIDTLTKRVAFFIVDGNESKKTLSNGKNANLIIERGPWWFSKISEYFDINTFMRDFEYQNDVLIEKYYFVVNANKDRKNG
jgi:hypothetical protein